MTKREQAFAKELIKCAGKWVATDDKRVIVCGDTIKEVREKAKEKQVDKPRIFSVPDPKRATSSSKF